MDSTLITPQFFKESLRNTMITNPLIISENESIGEIKFFWRHDTPSDRIWIEHYINVNPNETDYYTKKNLQPEKTRYLTILFDKSTNKLTIEGKGHWWVFCLKTSERTTKPETEEECVDEPTAWVSISQLPYTTKKTEKPLNSIKIDIRMTTKMYTNLKRWCLINY